jgi:hypothetical protein
VRVFRVGGVASSDAGGWFVGHQSATLRLLFHRRRGYERRDVVEESSVLVVGEDDDGSSARWHCRVAWSSS